MGIHKTKNATADQPLLIHTPKRMILSKLGSIWLTLFFATLFSFNVFFFISIPLYALATYLLTDLIPMWHAHLYRKLILYVITIISLLVFMVSVSFIRQGIISLIHTII